jgi:hypothetical protein
VTERKNFNEDDACAAQQDLWLEVAEMLKEAAFASVDNPDRLMRCAMMACAAYWQATGVDAFMTAQDFVKRQQP